MSKKDAFFLAIILALAGGWGYSHYQRTAGSAPPAVHGSAAIQGGEMCKAHGVPEAKCGFCNPELIESLGFCKGHGVPEVFCYQCDPDLAPAFQAAGDWCKEHAVPESQCKLCKASPSEADHEAKPPGPQSRVPVAAPTSAPASAPAEDILVQTASTAHSTPRHQQRPASQCTTHDLRVRFRTPAIEAKAGLELEAIQSGALSQVLLANANVSFNQNRYAHLTSRAPGVVRSVAVDIGDRVEAGAVLATVESMALGTAKISLLQAIALETLWRRNRAREADLSRQGISPERNLLEAETKLTESRIQRRGATQRLRNLGLSEADITRVGKTQETSSLLSLVAPFAGEVVRRHAVLGEVVDTNHPLLDITDPSTLWAMVDIYEEDLRNVEVGQAVHFEFDGLRGYSFTGPIRWLSRTLDPTTRTLQARVELEDRSKHLRAEMFGRAKIQLARADAVRVPKTAVQWDGTCNTVFVREAPGVYEPRRVWLGFETDGVYEVREGLSPGDTVVTTGSFLLKTEVMKSSIGAGCCTVETPRS